MGIHEDYFELVNYYNSKYGDKSIVFIQVGAFYEIYGVTNTLKNCIEENPTAYRVAQICDLKLANKQLNIGENRILHMCGFRDYQLDKYIEKLVDEGYTVAVYKQDEQTAKTTRSLLGVFSSGTFCGQSGGFSSFTNIKDEEYISHTNQRLSNHITCLSIFLPRSVVFSKKVIHFGLSSVDVFTGQSNLCEYIREYKHDSTTYDDIERYMAITQPQELLLCYPPSLQDEIKEIIDFIGLSECKRIHYIPIGNVTTTYSPTLSKMVNMTDTMSIWAESFKKCSRQTYQEEIIRKFYKDIHDIDFFMNSYKLYEHPNATHSFLFLLEFIYSQNPDIINKIMEPLIYTENNELILANHSLRQLNIIDDHHILESKTKTHISSVSRFINRCITAMGKRRQHSHIIRPTRDVDWLNRQYEITEYMMNELERRSTLYGISDLEKTYRKITMKKLAINDLTTFYKNILEIGNFIKIENPHMKKYLEDEKNIKFSDIQQSQQSIQEFIETNMCVEYLETMFDEETKNIFQSDKYPELDELYKKAFLSRDIIEGVCKYFNDLINKYEKKQSEYCKLYETAKSTPYIRMTKRRYTILKEHLKGIVKIPLNNGKSYSLDASKIESTTISGSSKTSDIRLQSVQLDGLLSSVAEYKDDFLRELDVTYIKFIDMLKEKQKDFENIIFYVTSLDVVLNRAFVSKEYNYCRPSIIDKPIIRAYDLRHVLIEHIQQNEIYVPNDVILGDDKDGILLFGTNASGKSSLIKSLGIALVMAQSGFYVPCSKFEYTPFKYIFTRILGNDNIFKNLSTYAVEMSEFRTILKYADEHSLVLGDELCSGTEIGSALSIFSAGLIQLHERKTKCIFATHFHQLTEYERITKLERLCFKHLKVEIDEHEHIYYDRKMYDGAGNNMYGLVVCKALGMPKDFLELANNIRLELSPDEKSITHKKTSKYNSRKITDVCEMCGNPAIETHHLLPQQLADKDGFIVTSSGTIHKNHKANLMSICEACHLSLHKEMKGEIIGHKRVKNTKKKIEIVEKKNEIVSAK
jgi:DNA mismatch repair protein MutS